MSAASTPLFASSTRPRPTVAFWAVFAWLGIQMLALLAAACRIPFSAHFPAPEEHLAMHEMLVAQMIGSALLFPLLMPCFSTAFMVIAIAPVMMLLAGLLAEAPAGVPLILACAYPALWLIALSMWAYILPTAKARLYGVAVATVLVVGGAMLAYLAREFGAPTETFEWAAHAHLGPLIGGITLLESGPASGRIWIFLGILLLISLGTALAFRIVRKRPFQAV
jgi:hypothetical protein